MCKKRDREKKLANINKITISNGIMSQLNDISNATIYTLFIWKEMQLRFSLGGK